MKISKIKTIIGLGLIAAALAVILPVAGVFAGQKGNGNEMPSGEHYNLNIIGVSKEKNPNMGGGNGHRIFVPLRGSAKIHLSQGDFAVLDANGTDGHASFQLPVPDSDDDGITTYSVFARALGTPGGNTTITTCGWAPGEDGTLGTADDTYECNASEVQVKIGRDTGKPKTVNVSKELLFLWDVDLDGDGIADVSRIGLFDDRLEGYTWEYDNEGLRILQLRFYPCATDVGDVVGDPISDVNCFTP